MYVTFYLHHLHRLPPNNKKGCLVLVCSKSNCPLARQLAKLNFKYVKNNLMQNSHKKNLTILIPRLGCNHAMTKHFMFKDGKSNLGAINRIEERPKSPIK